MEVKGERDEADPLWIAAVILMILGANLRWQAGSSGWSMLCAEIACMVVVAEP